MPCIIMKLLNVKNFIKRYYKQLQDYFVGENICHSSLHAKKAIDATINLNSV